MFGQHVRGISGHVREHRLDEFRLRLVSLRGIRQDVSPLKNTKDTVEPWLVAASEDVEIYGLPEGACPRFS